MALFKYFRPDVFFEKSVRYHELYFSSNHELNDPHDLKASYQFEDDPALWAKLLALPAPYDTWDINNIVDARSPELHRALNALFTGKSIDSVTGSVRALTDQHQQALLDLFVHAIKNPPAGFRSNYWLPDTTPEYLAQQCTLSLTELLSRAFCQVFHSVSFSRSALSPMMWAHYAAGFKGCVVIYNPQPGNRLPLYQHPRDRQPQNYTFLPVDYVDGAKTIPLLAAATGDAGQAERTFLQKNAFWRYEDEYRLFTVETRPSLLLAIDPMKLKNNRQRILHHAPDAIIGIIFGPRCDDDYKQKIELMLRDCRYYHDGAPFFRFDTELTAEGRVAVIRAGLCRCQDRSQMTELFEGERREKLLAELGIVDVA